MSAAIVVTGTDTDVGKTVFCAGLTRLLDGEYWKPVQAGLAGETDAEMVRRLAELPADRVLPEVWRLAHPRLAASRCRDRRCRDRSRRAVHPRTRTRPLIIEGAGGLMVPLTRRTLLIEVIGALGRAGGAVRAHAPRHHQSHAAVDRGTAAPVHPHARRRIHRRGASRKRAHHRRRSEASRSSAACRTSIRSPRETLAAAFSSAFARESFSRLTRAETALREETGSIVWHPFTQHALRRAFRRSCAPRGPTSSPPTAGASSMPSPPGG